MPGFDYGNARLRSMRSRLLSKREMEQLAEAGSLKGFIAGLTKTAYRKAVESALAHTSGMESIDEAMREDLSDTLGAVRHFYIEEASESVASSCLFMIFIILSGLRFSPAHIRPRYSECANSDWYIRMQHSPISSCKLRAQSTAAVWVPLAQHLVELRTGSQAQRQTGWNLRWIYGFASGKFLQRLPSKSVLASSFDLEAD
jgi:hypothetical protein